MFGIYDILKWHAVCKPEKCAVIFEGKHYCYREFNERINSISYGLHSCGIGKGSRVGLLLHNSEKFLSTFFALIKLGACVSPFNFRYTAAEIADLQMQTGCEYFIVGNEFEAFMSAVRKSGTAWGIKSIPMSDIDGGPSIDAFLAEPHPDWDYREDIEPDDVIFNIFTGGTTGTPKAAAHTQQSTLVRVIGYMLDRQLVQEDDVYICYSPLFHIGGIGTAMQALGVGATFYILKSFDLQEILNAVEKERATVISLIPPTILERIKEVSDAADFDFSSLRVLNVSGGSCDEATLELAFDMMPDVLITSGYGMSENGMYLQKTFGKKEYYTDKSLVLSLGKPRIFYEAKLVKPDGSSPAVNEPAELYGRGPALMKGYRGREDSFTPDGWFATGDIMYMDENGDYHFCSRSKDMIKSGGENIYAVEVENAITQDNPDVISCAVVGTRDLEWGEVVTAAVVKRTGSDMTERDIIEHCRKYIASYKKPRRVFFLDELPRTAVGKVNKVELRRMLAGMI